MKKYNGIFKNEPPVRFGENRKLPVGNFHLILALLLMTCLSGCDSDGGKTGPMEEIMFGGRVFTIPAPAGFVRLELDPEAPFGQADRFIKDTEFRADKRLVYVNKPKAFEKYGPPKIHGDLYDDRAEKMSELIMLMDVEHSTNPGIDAGYLSVVTPGMTATCSFAAKNNADIGSCLKINGKINVYWLRQGGRVLMAIYLVPDFDGNLSQMEIKEKDAFFEGWLEQIRDLNNS